MNTHTGEEIRFEGIHCELRIQQFPGGIVVLRIAGSDVGEFGDAPMLRLNERLAGGDAIDLFIDAREVRGASIEVSGEWARWLGAHRIQLRQVSMLTGSRYVQITADFVRRFADLQSVMKVYTDAQAFDSDLAATLGAVR
uniref:STAS domain-containing protein n=1 Tax=Solibacter usitatus (strain Ellin6076) TaxID=234267 RepID=Q02AH1_SOLUE